MIASVKRWLRTSWLTRELYQRLYDVKHQREERLANAALTSDGAKVLADFQDVMRKLDAEWYLAYGTCLGALRNHQFISHDLDMDFYLCPKPEAGIEEVKNALSAAGYRHHHDYQVEGKTAECSWERNGVNFDIFVLEEKPEGYGCYLFNRFPDSSYSQEHEFSVSLSMAPHITGKREIDLEGVMVPIPANAEDFMKLYYGENWIVPDPGYTWENSLPSRKRCTKRGYYIQY